MPEQESIHQLQTEIQTLKIKDEFRTKELDALMNKLSDTSSKLNALSENIGRLLAGQESHKTSDNEVRDELKIQEQNREDAIEHNEKIKAHNTKVDALIEQKRYFLARQELLNDDILKLKSKIKNLNILRKAFSTTGIVAYKLENLTKELETVINDYLSDLSDGQFQVIFRLTGEKLNIIVINNGQEAPIETVSGGEFSRIQTAILLAIRNVLSKIGGNYINLLFLDEITGVLDEAGKEKLIELLQEEDNLNIFLISHDFTHPLIDKISIIKNNNISSIH